MATIIKGAQVDTGTKLGQIPIVSAAYKFTGTLAGGATTTLTLPADTDPTLLVADVTILDTFSAGGDPTYNWWIPGDVMITVAKNSTQIKLINESTNSVQYTVVLR
jgi:hypothetical protein